MAFSFAELEATRRDRSCIRRVYLRIPSQARLFTTTGAFRWAVALPSSTHALYRTRIYTEEGKPRAGTEPCTEFEPRFLHANAPPQSPVLARRAVTRFLFKGPWARWAKTTDPPSYRSDVDASNVDPARSAACSGAWAQGRQRPARPASAFFSVPLCCLRAIRARRGPRTMAACTCVADMHS